MYFCILHTFYCFPNCPQLTDFTPNINYLNFTQDINIINMIIDCKEGMYLWNIRIVFQKCRIFLNIRLIICFHWFHWLVLFILNTIDQKNTMHLFDSIMCHFVYIVIIDTWPWSYWPNIIQLPIKRSHGDRFIGPQISNSHLESICLHNLRVVRKSI